MLFKPNEHVIAITRGEAVRIELELVFSDAAAQIAGESGVEPSRFVRHDVNPELFHARVGILPALVRSGADSSASPTEHERFEQY
jgi:predicted urease superfamily metal-dependent hydrolase